MVKESLYGSCFLTAHFGGLLGFGPLAKDLSDLSLFGAMASLVVMWDPPCVAGLVPNLYIYKRAVSLNPGAG